MNIASSKFAFSSIVVSLIAVVCFPLGTYAAEIVTSFDSVLTLNTDGTVDVVETIEYDFGNTNRHGIYRNLSTKHPEKASFIFKERFIGIEVTGISRDGEDEPFTIDEGRAETKVKIGDPDRTISGKHTYTIAYTYSGALSYPNNLPPELYLDINGTEWEVPFGRVSATVRGAEGMFGQNRSCYKGAEGETASCSIRVASDGAITFEATLLKSGETITIAQELTPGSAAIDTRERLKTTLLGLLIIPITVIGFGIYVYRYRTEHKRRAPVIPEYDPYPGILPMQMGVLQDNSLDPKDIAAAIVYLAEQGYLAIRKTERKVLFLFEVDDFEITLLKLSSATDPKEYDSILTILFSESRTVGDVITLSLLKSDRQTQQQNYIRIELLEKSIVDDLTNTNFYEKTPAKISTMQWIIWGVASICVIGLFVQDVVTPLYAVVTGGAVVIALLAIFLTRRLTSKGYEALRYFDGLKLYLSVAEKDRLDFHNAPERKPEHFLALLPYAIALGVEGKWAEVFNNIAISAPTWYAGSNTFNAADLSTSLGNFSSALASSAGVSASSGGGSSGGGGGGGGGGSW
jgi:uncharacterized membrane protein YgcG